MGQGCTPFHHSPHHPLALTAEHFRNPFFLSPKRCRRKEPPGGPGCPTGLPSSVARVRHVLGAVFPEVMMDLCCSNHSLVTKVTGCLPLPALEVSPAASALGGGNCLGHLALRVAHTPPPQRDVWPSPHTPDGALGGHRTSEGVIPGLCSFCSHTE